MEKNRLREAYLREQRGQQHDTERVRDFMTLKAYPFNIYDFLENASKFKLKNLPFKKMGVEGPTTMVLLQHGCYRKGEQKGPLLLYKDGRGNVFYAKASAKSSIAIEEMIVEFQDSVGATDKSKVLACISLRACKRHLQPGSISNCAQALGGGLVGSARDIGEPRWKFEIDHRASVGLAWHTLQASAPHGEAFPSIAEAFFFLKNAFQAVNANENCQLVWKGENSYRIVLMLFLQGRNSHLVDDKDTRMWGFHGRFDQRYTI
eukprot:g300.t1